MNQLTLPDLETRQLQLGATLIASTLVAGASWRITGTTAPAWTVLIVGCALGAWAHAWTWRVATVAVSLCLIPPGVIGENSARIAVAVSFVVYIALATAPVELSRPVSVALLAPFVLLAESIAFGLGAVFVGFPSRGASLSLFSLYALAAASLYETFLRPSLMIRAFRCLMWLVALACVSYLISYATRFAGATVLHLKYRSMIAYPPATFTQPSGGYLPGFPRLLVFGGEPGLGAIFILIATWCALRFERGRRRVVLLGLLGAGTLFSQSTGLLFALVAFALGVALVEITRRLTLGVSLVLALALIPVLKSLIGLLLTAKQTANPASLADRGFAVTGFHIREPVGDISLVATLAHHASLAIPLMLLIGYLAISAIRAPLSLGLLLAVASIGLYSQPLQWHPGAWLLVAAAVSVAGSAAPNLTQRVSSDRVPVSAHSPI